MRAQFSLVGQNQAGLYIFVLSWLLYSDKLHMAT